MKMMGGLKSERKKKKERRDKELYSIMNDDRGTTINTSPPFSFIVNTHIASISIPRGEFEFVFLGTFRLHLLPWVVEWYFLLLLLLLLIIPIIFAIVLAILNSSSPSCVVFQSYNTINIYCSSK